jgi:hypothetical protein
MTLTLTLQDIEPVTHDTHHLSFARPEGFGFEPGQAVELALIQDGWKDEGRPFTMVSQPDAPNLDFVIKSYPDHNGVTARIPSLGKGDQVSCDGPFGAITDHGPGLFLAAGAGVTPFISILKKHDREGVTGDTLILSNKTDKDIILKDTWDSLSGVTPVYVATDQPDTAHRSGKLDKTALQDLVSDLDQPFYLCGPQGFVDAMRDTLKEIGVAGDRLIIEDGW